MGYQHVIRAFSQHVSSLIFLFCIPVIASGQNADKAVFDLRDRVFAHETVSLEGEWEFFRDCLLPPIELDSTQSSECIHVPGPWNRELDYPALSYGTYRCKVLLPENHNDLLLYIPFISASASIWINGEYMCSAGKVDENKEKYKPELGSIHTTLPEHTNTFEIVIQVVNYSYYGGGLVTLPVIGNSDLLIKKEGQKNSVETFFAGSLVAMFVYHLILFLLYNDRKPNLWLSLICLAVALRAMVTNGGSFLLPDIFPSVPFEIWKKLEFGSVYLMVAVFPLFIYHLFESEVRKKIFVSLFTIAGILMAIPVILTPQYVYGELLDVFHLLLILAFVYAIATISIAWKRGNTDAKVIFFGVMVSFPFIFLEILRNTHFIHIAINFKYLVEIGLLFFLLFQAYTLARHYAQSFKSLETINQELEITVSERTQELVESNAIRERLLSVISHDVKSPLNSLQGLISVYNSKILRKEDFDKYLKKIEGNLINTNGLVENILYWTANQRRGNQVSIEPVALDLLVKENINHLQATINNKSLCLCHSVPEKFMIYTDRGILNFVIRNLMTNAIKFSHPNGKVQITLDDNEEHVAINVVDHGVGMTSDQLDALRTENRVESTKGTHTESGTGLGLSLCKEFLQKIGGKLDFQSELEKGSTFTINLPVREMV